MDAIDDREVQVSVTDQGHGVPPDRVADIFEPLFRHQRRHGHRTCHFQAIIEDAHGGRLWYELNLTGGAIFRFTLRRSGSRGKREPMVFIVDDDTAVRDSIQDLVESVGLRVEGYASALRFWMTFSRSTQVVWCSTYGWPQ